MLGIRDARNGHEISDIRGARDKIVQRETGGDSGEEGTESEEDIEANIGNAINSDRGQAGSGEVEGGETEVEELACSVVPVVHSYGLRSTLYCAVVPGYTVMYMKVYMSVEPLSSFFS